MLFKWATLLIPIVNILNPLVNHHFQTQSSYTKNPNVLLQSPQTSSYNPVRTRLEAQTICSTFGRLLLAVQPFAPPSSVSLLIPLQTILFRAPTDAALRWASEFLHVPPFSPCFSRFSFIFSRFFPTFFLPFLHFPPFSSSVTSRNLP